MAVGCQAVLACSTYASYKVGHQPAVQVPPYIFITCNFKVFSCQVYDWLWILHFEIVQKVDFDNNLGVQNMKILEMAKNKTKALTKSPKLNEINAML